MRAIVVSATVALFGVAVGTALVGQERPRQSAALAQQQAADRSEGVEPALRTAIFAGGCFWCMEAPFEKVDGVVDVISGFTGGEKKNPTYEEVSSGGSGHVEAIEVRYDPSRIKYDELLELFWRQIDPTDPGGQFADRGKQYRTVIFYHNEEQRRLAEASKAALEQSGRFDGAIATEILPARPFYPAEDYHQDYGVKNPLRYKYYRYRSGRDTYLARVWASGENQTTTSPERSREVYVKPSDEEVKDRLTPLQYKITQKDGTEPAFENEYWNSKSEGIYVDIVSGEPLFSSLDKFDSGTGWPSFTKPLEPGNVVEREDRGFFMVRTEVRSKHGDSHLGHVFPDGPPPTGLRYCMNSAALRFVPKADLEKEGYAEYLRLFDEQ